MTFDKKEALKVFKNLAKKHHYLSRTQALAYAFLRGAAYVKLERKINEDNFPEIGRNSFLSCLIYSICNDVYYFGKYEGYDLSFQEFLKDGNLREEIRAWVFAKYATKIEEVAA